MSASQNHIQEVHPHKYRQFISFILPDFVTERREKKCQTKYLDAIS